MADEPEQKVRKRPVPPTAFKKGQSGNPKGRPKGTGKKALEKKAWEIAVREHHIGLNAARHLKSNAGDIAQEVLRIALQPDKETVRTKEKDGKVVTTITVRPGDAKIRCLLACLDRLVPALKSVEVKQAGSNNPSEMTDAEIIELMQRMVDMTGDPNAKLELAPDKLDG